MTVLDFVRLTRTNLKVIVLMTLLGIALAYAWTLTRPVIYTASSTGIVRAGDSGSVGDIMAGSSLALNRMQSYAALVNTRAVGRAMAEELGTDEDPGSLAGSLAASPNAAAPILTISASAGTPEQAQARADAAVKAVALEGKRLDTGGDLEAKTSVELVPQESAILPTSPTSPNLKMNLLVGALGGLLGGYALSLLRRQLDSRVRIASDVEAITGVGTLGVIPETAELRKKTRALDRMGPAAEAMRHLRTNLRFVDVDNPPRSVVITSATQGEGKSTVSTNLARMLAAAGQPTLLVDADLRRPNVANLLDLDDSVGLTQVLAGDLTYSEAWQDTDQPGLKVLTAGRVPPNPSELLGSRRMGQLVEEMGRDHFVLFDAPPLLPVTDAGLLTTQTDGAVLVLHVGKTHKEQAALCRKIIEQVGGRLLGTVLNRASRKGMGTVVYGYGYGYGGYQTGYGSGYYSSGKDDDSDAGRSKGSRGKRGKGKRGKKASV
ncbi:polysaccharide biosynthesis tyrosine autokinase [Janibacter sp. GXQ6167]|uniref:polysaccharide biosynthesis tyrosine autokinase n=1 Tax=Janibacter sp. GXQ6167 TaxID=3240791 RepID=UPI003525057C